MLALSPMISPALPLLPPRAEMERAFRSGDAGYLGVFFVGVRTTGIFCLPTCTPPRKPRPENCEYFASVRDVVFAGYRPCKLCRPTELAGKPPDWVAQLIQQVEREPGSKLTAADLRNLGVSPERARRWFMENHGLTFTAWCRARRLSAAFTKIRDGENLDDVALGHGFESHSGFRDAFTRTFGEAPGRSRKGACLFTTMIETPIGRFLAATNDAGLVMFEFTDRRTLEHHFEVLRRRFAAPLVPGDHAHFETLRREIAEYFAGTRRDFTVPLAPCGTAFQERVWTELRLIPYAQTISYEALAIAIGQPTAMRAVALANGSNRLAILIPCHRVIGKDGSLTGYGGGLWRKRLLLELERTGRLPG
jgi:AraC family transcriptional regulator of adaptative response/methylated-DNA-[protein]-cysteine methyltransferase